VPNSCFLWRCQETRLFTSFLICFLCTTGAYLRGKCLASEWKAPENWNSQGPLLFGVCSKNIKIKAGAYCSITKGMSTADFNGVPSAGFSAVLTRRVEQTKKQRQGNRFAAIFRHLAFHGNPFPYVKHRRIKILQYKSFYVKQIIPA